MSSLRAQASFVIPEQTQEQVTFAKTDAQSIQQWLNDLPKANRGETARRLYFALQDINKATLSITSRLQIMELMRPSVHETSNALFGQHVKKTLSLSEKERKVAELAQVLQGLLLTGYKIAVSYLLSNTIDSQAKKSLIIAIHRAITDSSYILLRSYQLYTPPPARLWKELHALYIAAEQNGITQASFKNEESNQTLSVSIADSYKRCLLLSRARPNMLRQVELDQIFEILEKWTANATLEPDITENSAFAIDLTSDSAPVYSIDAEQGDSRHLMGLNTQKLVALIAKTCERPARDSLPIKLLHHLLSSWGFKTDRDHNRIPTSGTITFAAGLSATHFYISGEQPFHTTLAAFNATQESSKADYQSQNSIDNWEQMPNASGANSRMFAAAGNVVLYDGDSANAKTSYPLIQASLVNVSPGGCCAKMQSPVPAQIQTGEIIAMRSPSGYQWMLAIIRWVKVEGDDEVIFGIQHLSSNVWPSAISIVHKNRHASNFLRCFYLPEFKELNQPAYLITPRVPFQISSRVRFYNGGELITATLTECTITTGSVSQYMFKLYKPAETHLDDGMGMLPGELPVDSIAADDQFSTLWTEL